MATFLLVVPDFVLIALGWVLLHRVGFSRDFFASLERLVYFVLFPALLFHSITQNALDFRSTGLLLVATTSLLAFGIALGWLGRIAARSDAKAHASLVQCAFRFNSYLALSLAASLDQPQALTIMAVIVGFAVPIANIAAVHALATQFGGKVLVAMAKNPFILATFAALLCNFLDIRMPEPVNVALGRLGSSAIAIGLLGVGASLSLQGSTQHLPLMGWMISAKLLVMPLGALFIGHVLGLPPGERQVLLLFSALPTASTAYVLASIMGGDGRLVAVTTSVGTLISALTVPLFLYSAGVS